MTRQSCALLAIAMFVAGPACVAGCASDDIGPHRSGDSRLTACPSTNVVQDPPQFSWTYHPASAGNPAPYYSGVLEIGEATFQIGTKTLTTRAYRQAGGAYSIPGPTIEMAPGNKYVLRFHNTLPYGPASMDHNVFKDPNVSNVHTHGLHISGESPSDDVTRSFEGGFGGDFVYDIPANHMGGTYWYHAHHHGSTFLQISGGAFGQLIIDDGNDGVPANVAAMTERQLVVAYLDPSAAGTGGDTLLSGTLTPTWTVNGTVQGSLCMPQNEWQHWRVLLADRQATEKTISVGSSCTVAMLARDGVWRTSAPKLLTTNSISVTGASRVDLAVRCSNDSTLKVGSTTVANILVSGAGNAAVGPYSNGSTGSTWSANRPSYLRDLRPVATGAVHKETVHMGARTINGNKFDHDVPTFLLPANQVQEWSLGGATQHPFHLHVHHVQSLDCGSDYEDGEYYDVVASACSVRFDLNAATSTVYEGRSIMHCHILEHEDQGAMGWLDVVGGLPPPAYPADSGVAFPYAELYNLSAGGGSGGSGGGGGGSGGSADDSCPGTQVSLDLGGSTVLLGSTAGAADDYTTFCADNAGQEGRDVVYQVTLNAGGVLHLGLDDHTGTAEFDGARSLRKQCDARVGGDECANQSTIDESLEADLAAGTYWVVVDGANGQSGNYALSLELAAPVCGDGIVNDASAGEACDLPGEPALCHPSGHPQECQFGPLIDSTVDDCPGFDVLIGPGDDLDISGAAHNLCPLVDDHAGSCAGADLGARDAVYHFHPSEAGTLAVVVGRDAFGQPACTSCTDGCDPDCGSCFVPIVYARKGACSGPNAVEVGCFYDPTFATTVATLAIPVVADEDVWVFVDSNYAGPYTAGPYILEATLTP